MAETFQNIVSTILQTENIPAFEVVNRNDVDPEIRHLLIDSRNAGDTARSMFFAIRTERNDGHRYVAELYRRGVRVFVVSSDFDTAGYDDAAFIVVEQPERMLQCMGCAARRRKKGPVIALTGSRGKTLVKEWLAGMLGTHCKVARSPRSYNSSLGVPLSLWQCDDDADITIIEAGISREGEMSRLADIIKPDIVVLTDISEAHDEGFASREAKIAEKLLLACGAKALVYPSAVPGVAEAIEHAQSEGNIGRDIALVDSSTRMPEQSVNPNLKHDWEQANVATCISVMQLSGYDAATIADAVRTLRPINTRLNVAEGVNNCLIVADDYPFDGVSLGPALDFVNSRRIEGQRLTLIATALQQGNMNQGAYREIAETAMNKGVDRFICIGAEYASISSMMPEGSRCFDTLEDALRMLSTSDFSNELILLEGVYGTRLDELAHRLEARTHETVLEVNLDALVNNLNFYRSRLKRETGIVAMVKASGYGAGSYELAKTLQNRGAAYLAVAVLDEGIELREAGITMPIMVLNPKVLNYPQLFRYRLEPEIYDFGILNEIIAEAEKLGIKDYPIHIKLDTGMHRLGFTEEDIPQLLEVLHSQNCVAVSSVFSHLATADCPDMEDYARMQLEAFDSWSGKIKSSFAELRIKRHILNTAGILKFPEYQYDMVRLGIGLYGVPVLNDVSENGLRQVSTLRSPIISIKTRDEGATIGYGRRGKVDRRSVIATVPIGYADGIDRRMGCGAVSFVVNGVKCPTIGNICMDLLMLDVTEANASVGDSVVIFGEENRAGVLSDAIGTIPYEILTSVSPRVRRVYFSE